MCEQTDLWSDTEVICMENCHRGYLYGKYLVTELYLSLHGV